MAGGFRRLNLGVLVAALSVAALCACGRLRQERHYSSPTVRSPLRPSTWLLYPANRVLDFLDMASLGVMAGLGLNIRVQVTNVVEVAFPTNSAGLEVGWNTHWEEELEGPVALGLWGRYKPVAIGVHGGDDVPFPIVSINIGRLEQAPDTLAVGAHLVVVGVHAGIRPTEILDFLAGFVLIDLNGDDLHTSRGEEPED